MSIRSFLDCTDLCRLSLPTWDRICIFLGTLLKTRITIHPIIIFGITPFHLKINVYHISYILWIKALPVYQNFLSNELSNLFMWFFIISWVELFTIERKLSLILQFNLNIRIFEVEHYHRDYWESGLWHKGCAPLPTVWILSCSYSYLGWKIP